MNFFRTPEAEAVLSANNFAALQKALFGSSTKPEIFTEEIRNAYIEAWSQSGALTGGLNWYRAAKAGPPTSAGAAPETNLAAGFESLRVNVPTLVIWGEQDVALLTGCLEGLADYVSDLTVKRVPHGSHWVVNEEPELVNQYIREFITT